MILVFRTLHADCPLFLPWARDIGPEMISGLTERNPFYDNEAGNQSRQGARSGISIMQSLWLPVPRATQQPAHDQHQQRQQINYTYPAQYRAFGDRYDDLVAHTGIGWIVYLESAGFAAKQPGQLARPATLAIALITTVNLAGLNNSMSSCDLHNNGASLQHVHLPL